MSRGRGMRWGSALLIATLLASCGSTTPSATPYPTPVALQPLEDVPAAVEAFLGEWRDGQLTKMYQALTAADRESMTQAQFSGPLHDFQTMAQVQGLQWQAGTPERVVLPAAPRAPDAPPPSPTPRPSGATPAPTATGAA